MRYQVRLRPKQRRLFQNLEGFLLLCHVCKLEITGSVDSGRIAGVQSAVRATLLGAVCALDSEACARGRNVKLIVNSKSAVAALKGRINRFTENRDAIRTVKNLEKRYGRVTIVYVKKLDSYNRLKRMAKETISREEWFSPTSLSRYTLWPDKWSLVDLDNKCIISGDIRKVIKNVQQQVQVDKITKSSYALMQEMNSKLSCKPSTDFLRNPAIKNKIWRFYCLVRQGRLPTEVYKAKTIVGYTPNKCKCGADDDMIHALTRCKLQNSARENIDKEILSYLTF
jgi:hypothetical protein